MVRIGAARFKEQCLSILDHLAPGGLVITKHGVPVARLVPYDESPARLIGCLAGRIEVKGDLLSTGLRWDADAAP
jgi:antitoxin (DNA-binding transcriptional repressor) of toxin-antitoxin stability system